MIGFRFGARSAGDEDSARSTPPIGSVVNSMLALLAFMMALTFSSAATRYETRKTLLLDDIDAISEVYHRSDLLSPTDRNTMREYLREYVDLRLEVTQNLDHFQSFLERSEQLQQKMSDIVNSARKSDTNLLLSMRLMDSLDEMVRIHSRRIVHATQYRIHPTIWFTLLAVAILSLSALGFQFGVSGGRRYQVGLLLAICFSGILLIIVDIDRPGDGTVRVDQFPLEMLRASMAE